MAETDFDETATKVPTGIGKLVWTVTDPDGSDANRTLDGNAEVVNGAGEIMGHIQAKDLTGILTTQEKINLKAITDKFRARAEGKLP